VGQVKKEDKGVKLGGGQTRVDIGGLVVSSSKPSAGFGGFVLKTIGDGFTGLGIKTRAEVPRRNRRYVVASGRSCRGEAIGEEERWPLDEDEARLDHNALGLSGLTQLYSGAKLRLCNSLVK
jgi:hypothetical protein